jgi:mRNA interferase MazF
LATGLIERQAVLRGEVWIVELDPVVGSEQAKARPCVVMQRDAANRSSRTTVVVPLTDSKNRAEITVQPLFRKGEGGLTKDSVAMCAQVRVIDRLRLRQKIGRLSEDAMHIIGIGLAELLDLSHQ